MSPASVGSVLGIEWEPRPDFWPSAEKYSQTRCAIMRRVRLARLQVRECRIVSALLEIMALTKRRLAMPAFPPKADIRQRIEHVCFVPGADIVAARFTMD